MPPVQGMDEELDTSHEHVDYTLTLGDEPDEDETVDAAGEDADAEAAFAEGFNDERVQLAPSATPPGKTDEDAAAATDQGEDTTSTQGDGTQQTAAADTKQTALAEEDPWKDVNPAVKAAFAELKGKVDGIPALEHKLRSAEGRISAITAGKQAAKDAEAAGGDAPNARQIQAAAAAGGEKWKQLEKDWPEWAAALEERFTAFSGNSPQSQVNTEQLTRNVVDSIQPSMAEIQESAIQYAVTEIKHPGWRDEIKTPKFHAWFKAQPEDVRALAKGDHSSAAVELMDRFKGTYKPPAQQRSTERLEAALGAPRGTGGLPPNQSAQDAFNAGFKSVRQG